MFDPDPAPGRRARRVGRRLEGIGMAAAAPRTRGAVRARTSWSRPPGSLPPERQVMPHDWLAAQALVSPSTTPRVRRRSRQRCRPLLVEPRGEYLANRDIGNFDGYPDPGR